MKQRIKGVIFDWNGVLSNDIPKIFAVTMKTVAKTGGKPIKSFQEYRRKVQNPWYPFYRGLGCVVSKAEIEKWYWHYFKRTKISTSLSPGVKSLLHYLTMQGVKIGIVSSHPIKGLKSETAQYGISHYFDFMKGDAHTKRNHIKLFLKLFRLKPWEVICVGDMIGDVRAGKQCGVVTAAYLKGVDTKRKLAREKPDIFLPTLSALKLRIKTPAGT